MSLTVICPSRGRPRQAQAVFESFMDTRKTDAAIRFALDADDPSTSQYPPCWKSYPSHSAVEALNFAAQDVTSEYIAFVGDDNRFITPGWDTEIIAALDEMSGGVVYPNDLVIPGSLPSTVFMSTAICRAVGYFALPVLKINYWDNCWADLGKGIGKLKYLPDVAIQHLSLPHWWATPEQGERHEAQVLVDRQNYLEWFKTQRKVDVEKAKSALLVPA